MLENRPAKLALIHLAKKDCALDDTLYRALLQGAAAVSSASEIESETQFDSIMLAFKRLGFTSSSANARKKSPYVSNSQLAYIRILWNTASREKSESALRAMVRRIGHVADPRFLSKKSAQALILALRTMCWKAGKNPDLLKTTPNEPGGVS